MVCLLYNSPTVTLQHDYSVENFQHSHFFETVSLIGDCELIMNEQTFVYWRYRFRKTSDVLPIKTEQLEMFESDWNSSMIFVHHSMFTQKLWLTAENASEDFVVYKLYRQRLRQTSINRFVGNKVQRTETSERSTKSCFSDYTSHHPLMSERNSPSDPRMKSFKRF